MILHVTNGDVVADQLRAAGLPGDVLSWDDVLHQGPVPAGLSLDELGRERARYLASWPWVPDRDGIAARFVARDRALGAARGADEVVLWFEHDLHDQLQLVQLLHWFEMRPDHAGRLSLLCIGSHPDIERFTGLGQLGPERLAALWPERRPVEHEQLDLGRRAWEAFTSARPSRLEELVADELAPLPFLRAALHRFLEEYPATDDGLGRSERQALAAVADGPRPLGDVFRVSQHDDEARPFMGDLGFLVHVAALTAGDRPLARVVHEAGLEADPGPPGAAFWERPLEATDTGREVLRGRLDRTEVQAVDRWLGGVHLRGDPLPYRFDRANRRLVARRG